MGLPAEAIVGIVVGGLVLALGIGKYMANGNSQNSQPVVRDESINNEYNISGGRSRRNRQRKNKSRRR
jgi:hypothetical protein